MSSRPNSESLGDPGLQTATPAAFQALPDSETDLQALQAKLDGIRGRIRQGDDEAARQKLNSLLPLLEQAAAGSNATAGQILLAEALALHGTSLNHRGLQEESRQVLARAIALFEAISNPPAEDGQYYGDYGMALMLVGRHDESRKPLELARQFGTKVPEVSKMLGLLYKEKGEWAAAAELLREAEKTKPEDLVIKTSLAAVYESLGQAAEAAREYREAGNLNGARGRYRDALACFQLALETGVRETASFFGCGEALRLLGRFEESLEYFDDAIRSDPQNGWSWISKSKALLGLKKNEEALAAANEAVRLAPSEVRGILARAEALDSMGRRAEAIEELTAALEQAPGDLGLLWAKANILYQAGRLGEFQADAERAISLNPKSAALHLLKARMLRALGRLPEAEETLQSALELDSETNQVFNELAELLNLEGKTEEAIAILRKAIVRNPRDANTWSLRSAVLEKSGDLQGALGAIVQSLEAGGEVPDRMKRLADLLVRLQRLPEAEKVARRVTVLDSGRDSAWFTLADILSRSGKLEEALETLDRAIALRENWSLYIASRGLLLQRLGRTEDAVVEYRRALQSDPQNTPTRDQLIALLVELGRNEEALPVLEAGLELTPRNAELLVKKSSCLRALRRSDEALAAATAAVEEAPDLPAALGEKALLLQNKGEAQAALELITRALEKVPENGLWWAVKGGALFDLARFDEALEALDKANAILPNYVYGLRTKARILRKKGRIPEALELFEKVLEIDPGDQVALLQKGLCLITQKPAEAILPLEALLKLNPSSLDGLLQLGDAYRRCKRYKDALAQLDEAIRLSPQFWAAIGTKGQVLIAQQRWQEGVDLLQQAVAGDPRLGWAWSELGDGLRCLGRTNDALAALERALEYQPDDEMALSSKAWVLMDLNRLPESVEILNGLLARYSEWAYYHAQLGEALRRLEQWEKALQALDRAIELDKDQGLAIAIRSRLLSDVGRFEEAIAAARKAAEALQESWIFTLLGWALENAGEGNGQAAYEAYRRAHEIDPSDLWNLKGMGSALRLAGRREESRKAFREVIEAIHARTEKGENTTSLLAWCHYGVGEYDEAIRLYLASLSVTSPLASDRFDLGVTLVAAGRHGMALDCYRRAIEESKAKHVWRQRGMLHVGLWDLVEVLRDPTVPEADSGVEEVGQSFRLMKQGLEEAGGKAEVAMPERKSREAKPA